MSMATRPWASPVLCLFGARIKLNLLPHPSSNASSQHLTLMMHCTDTSPQDCQSKDGTSLDKQIQEQVQFNYRTEGILMFLGDKMLVPRINKLCIAVQWSDKYTEASEESSHRLCQESNSKTKMKSENPNTFFIKKPPQT